MATLEVVRNTENLSSEKAGVGGSTPSLATTFSIAWSDSLKFHIPSGHCHLGLTAAAVCAKLF
jgi:hypothetical protein